MDTHLEMCLDFQDQNFLPLFLLPLGHHSRDIRGRPGAFWMLPAQCPSPSFPCLYMMWVPMKESFLLHAIALQTR